MTKSDRTVVSPAQLVAARQLLRWSRERLAAKIGSSQYLIRRFEDEGLVRKSFSPEQARAAFEDAGVEFIETSRGRAVVSLRKAAR